MDYSQQGMFSKSGVTFKRASVYGGEQWSRGGGRYIGCMSVAVVVNVLAFFGVTLLGVFPACMTMAMFFYGRRPWTCEEAVLQVATVFGRSCAAFAFSLLVQVPFFWTGRMSGAIAWRVKAVLVAVLCWCARGDFAVAASWLATTGALVWWYESGRHSELVYSLRFVTGLSGVAAMIFVAIHKNLLLFAGFVFLLECYTVSRRRLAYDRRLRPKERIDRGNKGKDYDFARELTGLSFDKVPFNVMQLVTHAPEGDLHPNFRMWAQVGDAAIEMALVMRGFRRGVTVGTISQWKQTFSCRANLGAVTIRSADSSKRFTGVNGVLSNNTAAEAFEAVVGVAFHYQYRDGKDSMWADEMMEIVCNKMGLCK